MSPKAAARPPSHGLYLHTTRDGTACISVTKASSTGQSKPGKRMATLRGTERDTVYPHAAAILHNEENISLTGRTGEYRAIDETTATHVQLAMMAVREAKDTHQAQRLASVVANMHNAEARWWYAHYRERTRPKNIIQAIALGLIDNC